MRTEQFISYFEHPEKLDFSSVSALDEILREYPFCQPAQILYLKGLHNEENIRFNRQLKLTAAYATNRKLLFDILNIPKRIEKIAPEPAHPIENSLLVDDFDLLLFDFPTYSDEPVQTASEIAELQKEEFRSVAKKPTDELIDRFIENTQPRVLRPDHAPVIDNDVSVNSLKEDDSFLTETLARIYVQQKYFLKAIQAYEKLSLKIPEKSVYFASQIEMVRELIKNQ